MGGLRLSGLTNSVLATLFFGTALFAPMMVVMTVGKFKRMFTVGIPMVHFSFGSEKAWLYWSTSSRFHR